MGQQVDDEIRAREDERRRNRKSDRELVLFAIERLHVIEMGAVHQAEQCPYCSLRQSGATAP